MKKEAKKEPLTCSAKMKLLCKMGCQAVGWCLVAITNGMALAAADSSEALCAISIAVGLLSILDASALALQLGPMSDGGAAFGASVGMVGICCVAGSFPTGVAIALSLVSSAKAWAMMLYLVSANLLYTAFFKYFLPPTKGRLNNVLLYFLFFSGALLPYLLQPRSHPFTLVASPLV